MRLGFGPVDRRDKAQYARRADPTAAAPSKEAGRSLAADSLVAGTRAADIALAAAGIDPEVDTAAGADTAAVAGTVAFGDIAAAVDTVVADIAAAADIAAVAAADIDSDPEQRWELLRKRQPTNLREKR